MVKKYVEYRDRDEEGKERIVKGVFEIIGETENWVIIKTARNIIKLPVHNIEKIKERI